MHIHGFIPTDASSSFGAASCCCITVHTGHSGTPCLWQTAPMHQDMHVDISAMPNLSQLRTLWLLQAHFQRTNLSGDLATDQAKVLTLATRFLQACVDVISTSNWLNPALAAMEMSQMIIQAMWQTDPVLLQLPHFSRDLAKKCGQANITTIIASQEEGSSLADMEVSVLCFARYAVIKRCALIEYGWHCYHQLACKAFTHGRDIACMHGH